MSTYSVVLEQRTSIASSSARDRVGAGNGQPWPSEVLLAAASSQVRYLAVATRERIAIAAAAGPHHAVQEARANLSAASALARATAANAAALGGASSSASGADAEHVTALEWLEDGPGQWFLLAGYRCGLVRCFAADGRLVLTQLLHGGAPVRSIRVSPRRNPLYASPKDLLVVFEGGIVCFVDGRSIRLSSSSSSSSSLSSSSSSVPSSSSSSLALSPMASTASASTNSHLGSYASNGGGGGGGIGGGGAGSASSIGATGGSGSLHSDDSGSASGVGVRHDWSFHKWRLESREHITDVVLAGEHESMPRLLAVGAGPMIGFYVPPEKPQSAGLSMTTLKLASQLTSAVFSIAKRWWGGGGSGSAAAAAAGGGGGAGTGGGGAGGAGGDDSADDSRRFLNAADVPNTATPEANELAAELVLKDSGREILTAATDPSRTMALIADNFGRVLLIDLAQSVVVRMWKGYRDVQIAWRAGRPLTIILHQPRTGRLELWRPALSARQGVATVPVGSRLTPGGVLFYPDGRVCDVVPRLVAASSSSAIASSLGSASSIAANAAAANLSMLGSGANTASASIARATTISGTSATAGRASAVGGVASPAAVAGVTAAAGGAEIGVETASGTDITERDAAEASLPALVVVAPALAEERVRQLADAIRLREALPELDAGTLRALDDLAPLQRILIGVREGGLVPIFLASHERVSQHVRDLDTEGCERVLRSTVQSLEALLADPRAIRGDEDRRTANHRVIDAARRRRVEMWSALCMQARSCLSLLRAFLSVRRSGALAPLLTLNDFFMRFYLDTNGLAKLRPVSLMHAANSGGVGGGGNGNGNGTSSSSIHSGASGAIVADVNNAAASGEDALALFLFGEGARENVFVAEELAQTLRHLRNAGVSASDAMSLFVRWYHRQVPSRVTAHLRRLVAALADVFDEAPHKFFDAVIEHCESVADGRYDHALRLVQVCGSVQNQRSGVDDDEPVDWVHDLERRLSWLKLVRTMLPGVDGQHLCWRDLTGAWPLARLIALQLLRLSRDVSVTLRVLASVWNTDARLASAAATMARAFDDAGALALAGGTVEDLSASLASLSSSPIIGAGLASGGTAAVSALSATAASAAAAATASKDGDVRPGTGVLALRREEADVAQGVSALVHEPSTVVDYSSVLRWCAQELFESGDVTLCIDHLKAAALIECDVRALLLRVWEFVFTPLRTVIGVVARSRARSRRRFLTVVEKDWGLGAVAVGSLVREARCLIDLMRDAPAATMDAHRRVVRILEVFGELNLTLDAPGVLDMWPGYASVDTLIAEEKATALAPAAASSHASGSPPPPPPTLPHSSPTASSVAAALKERERFLTVAARIWCHSRRKEALALLENLGAVLELERGVARHIACVMFFELGWDRNGEEILRMMQGAASMSTTLAALSVVVSTRTRWIMRHLALEHPLLRGRVLQELEGRGGEWIDDERTAAAAAAAAAPADASSPIGTTVGGRFAALDLAAKIEATWSLYRILGTHDTSGMALVVEELNKVRRNAIDGAR